MVLPAFGGETIGEIARADWYRVMVWKPELMSAVLEVAERGGTAHVAQLLQELGVTLRHPPPASNHGRCTSRGNGSTLAS